MGEVAERSDGEGKLQQTTPRKTPTLAALYSRALLFPAV